jgi:uncharacterized membrane protein
VIRPLLVALSSAILATAAGAQPSAAKGTPLPTAVAIAPSNEPGSQLTVFLVTMGPGDQVWEKFGHNAIWIHDALNQTDIAYNWGMFDFADKDFIPRFVQGRMRYSMGAFDMSETIEQYRQSNRTVWSQELNMTPSQRQQLAAFVAWNILPQNRNYHYDYYRDNCSTRVRDALNAALGGVIRRENERVSSGTTYRFHTARLTQDDWPVFTGTMIGLGEPVDRTITAWDEMFLPVRMMDRLRSMSVPSAGGVAPLVTSERVLFQATRAPEETRVKRGIAGYLAIAVVIIAFGVALWLFGDRRGRGSWTLTLAAIWSLIAGLAGVLLAGLWGFTDHLYSYRNENVLQLSPLSLILAALLIRLVWLRRRSPAPLSSRVTASLAVAIAALSVIGFLAQALPGVDQVNGSVIALAMPLHLALVALLLAPSR